MTIGFISFFLIGCGVNKIKASIQEDCSYRVSSNGIIHSKDSKYYNMVSFFTNLCKDEAVLLSNKIK